MPRRSYTAEQRAEALALYETDGPTIVQQRLGIPKATVTAWAKSAGIGTVRDERTAAATESIRLERERRRTELQARLLDKAHDALDRMDEPHIDFKGKDADEVTYPKPSPQGFQAYATAAAILLDKFRLEMGEATARTEHDHFEPLDRELAKLAAEVKANA